MCTPACCCLVHRQVIRCIWLVLFEVGNNLFLNVPKVHDELALYQVFHLAHFTVIFQDVSTKNLCRLFHKKTIQFHSSVTLGKYRYKNGKTLSHRGGESQTDAKRIDVIL